jgi:hypothetical protein
MHTCLPTPTAVPAPTPVMPTHDHDNQVLYRVLADHGLDQAILAADTGISHSFLSRVFSGQYSAPPVLLRAMWARTRDHRVLRVALGDAALDELHTQPTDQRRALVVQTAVSLGMVSDALARLAADRGSPSSLRAAMADASRCMRALDSHLQTAATAPGKVDLRA